LANGSGLPNGRIRPAQGKPNMPKYKIIILNILSANKWKSIRCGSLFLLFPTLVLSRACAAAFCMFPAMLLGGVLRPFFSRSASFSKKAKKALAFFARLC
jgi:hypothetical protein